MSSKRSIVGVRLASGANQESAKLVKHQRRVETRQLNEGLCYYVEKSGVRKMFYQPYQGRALAT
jgi:hypothetical protein